jgi:hypothetical protein
MSSGPLRFLVLAVGLWVGARAAILAPGWWPGQSALSTPTAAASASASTAASTSVSTPAAAARQATASLPGIAMATADLMEEAAPEFLIRNRSYKKLLAPSSATVSVASGEILASGASFATGAPLVPTGRTAMRGHGPDAAPALPRGAGPLPAPYAAGPSPWSASAWLLVRRDQSGKALARGGTLGGSQAGSRIDYRLGGGLSVGALFYAPLRTTQGAEVAVGLDWQPVAAMPVHLRAERRQALGHEGRSAFALSVHGGTSRTLPRRLRLDLYGQTGVVGVRARDVFVDGAVRLSAPVGPVEIGAGAWGAAQPGAARLDAGPGLSYRLPVRGINVRLEASWRFRLAGDAAPRSGPALTLGTDF